MREANRIVSVILDKLGEAVEPGVPTMRFEQIARDMCKEFDVTPAFLGYNGFPFALCCSVNEEVVHGFPSDRILREGDLVSLDMGVIYDGFYGDSARTFEVGEVSPEASLLCDVTRESLMKGIAQAVEGNFLYDISRAIQEYLEQNGFSVVKRFVGHGIGRQLHEKPAVPNYVPIAGRSVALKNGMVLAIEPMACVGTAEVEILEDKWTAATKDRKLSAHFEHTVALTPNGPEILSRNEQ